jgi:hypothetical protein
VESRKDELIAKIRERRSRLEQTMATLDDRVAEIRETKDKVVKTGRVAVAVIVLGTVTLATILLLRAVASRLGQRRVLVTHRWR